MVLLMMRRRRKMEKNGDGSKTISFFRTLEGEEAHEGQMSEIEKFFEFWEGI